MDEFEFVNQYEVNEKRYLYWLSHPVVKTKQAHVAAAFKAVWTLLGLFVALNAWKGFSSGEYGFGAVFVLLTLYCIYRGFLRGNAVGRNIFKRLSEIQGAKSWVRTIRFGDKIYLNENTTAAEYFYDQVEEVREVGQYYALIYKGAACIYVSRDGFLKGDPKQFAEWIREKYASYEGEKR